MPIKTVMGAVGPNALHEYRRPLHPPKPTADAIKPADKKVSYPYNIVHDAYDQIAALNMSYQLFDWEISTKTLPRKAKDFYKSSMNDLYNQIQEISGSPRVYFALLKLSTPDFWKALNKKSQKNIELAWVEYARTLASTTYEHILIESVEKQVGTKWKKAYVTRDLSNILPISAHLFNLVISAAVKAAKKMGGSAYDHLITHYDQDYQYEKLKTLAEASEGPVRASLTRAQKEQERFLLRHLPVKAVVPQEKQIEMARKIYKYLGLNEPLVHVAPNKPGLNDFRTQTLSPYDIRTMLKVEPAHPLEIVKAAFHEAGHALYYTKLPHGATWINQPLALPRGRMMEEAVAIYFEIMLLQNIGFLKHFAPIIAETFGVSGPEWSWQNLYLYFTRSFIENPIDQSNTANDFLVRLRATKVEFLLMNGDHKYSEYPSLFIQASQDVFGRVHEPVRQMIANYGHWANDWGYDPLYIGAYLLTTQFHRAIKRDLPNLDSRLEKGDPETLINWWTQNIFKHGSFYTTQELIMKATGKPITPRDFGEHCERLNLSTRPRIAKELGLTLK